MDIETKQVFFSHAKTPVLTELETWATENGLRARLKELKKPKEVIGLSGESFRWKLSIWGFRGKKEGNTLLTELVAKAKGFRWQDDTIAYARKEARCDAGNRFAIAGRR